MNPRFRFIAALLVLLAFSAHWAESLWASQCAPPLTAAEMAAELEVEPCPMDPMGEPSGSADPHAPDAPSQDSAHCPLVPMGTSGSCTALSCPAGSVASPDLTGVASDVMTSFDPGHDLLVATTLFHPPRA